jgi:hypothetical protein
MKIMKILFRIFAIFSKYMKNKIGILENDIYIFPIVNSVNLLFCKVHSFSMCSTTQETTAMLFAYANTPFKMEQGA